MKVAVFDIGGTRIKYGNYDTELGKLSSLGSVATEGHLGASHVMETVLRIFRDRLSVPEKPTAIGICTRGQVDTEQGYIISDSADVIADYEGFSPTKALSSLGIPVVLENDANCSAYAEHQALDPGTHSGPFCMMTFGTGIGAAIILDGKLYRGANFSAGEAGMMYYNKGHYEQSASIHTFRANRREWLNVAARSCASLIHVMDPETLVIGGGIPQDRSVFNSIKEKTLSLLAPGFNVSILPASLGNKAGLVGIGLLAAQQLGDGKAIARQPAAVRRSR